MQALAGETCSKNREIAKRVSNGVQVTCICLENIADSWYLPFYLII